MRIISIPDFPGVQKVNFWRERIIQNAERNLNLLQTQALTQVGLANSYGSRVYDWRFHRSSSINANSFQSIISMFSHALTKKLPFLTHKGALTNSIVGGGVILNLGKAQYVLRDLNGSIVKNAEVSSTQQIQDYVLATQELVISRYIRLLNHLCRKGKVPIKFNYLQSNTELLGFFRGSEKPFTFKCYRQIQALVGTYGPDGVFRQANSHAYVAVNTATVNGALDFELADRSLYNLFLYFPAVQKCISSLHRLIPFEESAYVI